MFWKTLPTTHRILAVVGIVYLINAFVFRGALTSLLALFPSEAIGRWQYWRFFTYPFALADWSIIPATITLYFFAPEVEEILGARKTLLTMALFVMIHGVIYTPLMLMANVPLAGPQAAALLILTMYVYLYPSGEVSLFGLVPLRATLLLGITLGIAFLTPLLARPMSPLGFIHVFADELFGVFAGFLFSYLYFGRASRTNTPRFWAAERSQPPVRRTPASTAPISRSSTPAQSESKSSPLPSYSEAEHDEPTSLDEERLNEILDKINEKGQASLTSSEQKFLKEYARRL